MAELRTSLIQGDEDLPLYAHQKLSDPDRVKWTTSLANMSRCLDLYLAIENAYDFYGRDEALLLDKSEKEEVLDRHMLGNQRGIANRRLEYCNRGAYFRQLVAENVGHGSLCLPWDATSIRSTSQGSFLCGLVVVCVALGRETYLKKGDTGRLCPQKSKVIKLRIASAPGLRDLITCTSPYKMLFRCGMP